MSNPYSYFVIPMWAACGAATYFVSRRWGFRGLLVVHLLVFIVFSALGIASTIHEMDKSDWSGNPDFDIVGTATIAFTAIFVNVTLLPVALVALALRGRAMSRVEPEKPPVGST